MDMFSQAASLIRKAGSEIKATGNRVLNTNTPLGVGRAAVGLVKDRAAAKKSEAGLNNIRAKAAAKLGQMNRQTKTMKAAVPMTKTVTMPQHSQFSSRSSTRATSSPVLTNKQITDIKASSTLSEAGKNAMFERDMRKRQSLGLPR